MTKKELIFLMVATDATLTIQTAESTLNAFTDCIIIWNIIMELDL